MRRFKLKVGHHTTRGKTRTDGPTIFKPGDVIETDTDLVKLHGADKFVELAPKVAGKPAVEIEEEITTTVVDADEDDDDEEEEEKPATPEPAKPKRRK